METPKLKRVTRLDSIKLDGSLFTDEGFIISEPVVTTCGIFEYKNPDGSIRKELRLPEHVFDEESLASYEGKPLIITHAAGRVDKNNTDVIVGTMMSAGYRDGDNVRVKIVVHDSDKVKKSGLRELSLGYDLDIDESPGEYKGEKYDAIQTNIRVNHLALVKDARAGNQARLNIDSKEKSQKGNEEMSENKKRRTLNPISAYKARQKRRLDELEEDAFIEGDGEEDIEDILESLEGGGDVDPLQLVKDRRDRRDTEGDPETPETAMSVIAQQDEDIETLIKCIEELKAQADMAAPQPEPEQEDEDEQCDDDEPEIGGETAKEIHLHLDSLVSERLALARIGDRLKMNLDSMKPEEAKKAIIQKVNPSMRLDGKSKDYINAAYDLAVDQIGKRDANYQRKQMATRADSATYESKAEAAKQRMKERMNGGKQ